MQLHLALIMAALLEGARDKRGVDWCRKWGVGYARRRIGNVSKILPHTEASDARVRAAEELRNWCRACDRCKMARE